MKFKLSEKIKELQEAGYEVELSHYRVAQGEGVNPKGGITYATISREDNQITSGEAVCSKEDNYNKNIGGCIALGRAIADSPEQLLVNE